MQATFCNSSCLFWCAPVFHCASIYLLQSNDTCCDLHLPLPVSAINLSQYERMRNFKKISLIKNFQRGEERGTHKFLRETIYYTKYTYCFLVIKPLEMVMNVTQIFHNYMMTTKKILSLCCLLLALGKTWDWLAFSSYRALKQDSNYAVDVMYKPQDTGRRNRVCLEFVWEQMKK